MRVQTSLVCAVLCTVLSSINALGSDSVKYADSYGAAYNQAVEEKKELFVFFEPTKPSKENTEFVETTLKDANVLKDLEARVVVKVSTEQKIDEKGKPLSQDKYFRNEALSTVGGWVVISFVKNAKGDLKNSYAFQPASGPSSFKTWEAKNVDGVLTGRITQELPAIPGAVPSGAVVQNGQVAQGGGPGGQASVAMDLINQYRASRGLNALSYDPSLVFWDNSAHTNHYNRGCSAGAWGSGYGSGQAAVAGWQSSPPHNAQLLMGGISRHGVYFDGSTWVWAAK